MKISVKNFGPIHEANIRLAPLTLFVGPSNTGKSYLAKAISAAIESVAGAPKSGATGEFSDFVFITSRNRPEAKKHLEMERHFSKWAKDTRRAWKKCFGDFFGEQGENIAKDMNMSVRISSNDGRTFVDLNKLKSEKSEKIEKQKLPDLVETAELILNSTDFQAEDQDTQISTRNKIYKGFASSLCGNISLNIYYLPASRGGVMQSYRVIADKSVRRMCVLRDKNDFWRISGMLGGFARQLAKIEVKKNGDGEVNVINKNLERKILGGRINIKFSMGSLYFRYVMDGKKDDMAMNDVSAAIAELAPLSVFMSHYLQPKDVLIFEEPETGLHPQAQRDIADIMVRLVNEGVFVLATTHSDTVLEQIGNAIRASQFNNVAKGEKLLGKNRQPLALENAAVYDFGKQSKHGGTVVKEVPFKSITGVLTKDHIKVAHELYDQTVDLVNSRNDELA